METNLREIERDPVPKLVDELRWEDLRQIAQPLYAGGDQDGLAEMREMHQKLQAAIDAADGKQITRQFNAYRRKAGTCFYQVDNRLRGMCTSLEHETARN